MNVSELASDLWTDARLFAMSSGDRMDPAKNIERLERRLIVAIDAAVKQTIDSRQSVIAEAAEVYLFRKRKALIDDITKLTQELGELERKKKGVTRETAIRRVAAKKRRLEHTEVDQSTMQSELDELEARQ